MCIRDRVGPRLPALTHWGWLGAIDYQRGGKRSVNPDYFRKRLVDEPAPWGANLLEFYAPDMEQGFPFPWAEDDPIPRPPHYWGGAFDALWDEEAVRELTAYARARGFLVHGFHHPSPVRGPAEHFAAYAELTAREFLNPLLHGSERAWDGFGTEWFPADREARITAALWKYSPGAYQHSTAVLPAYTPNFSGTLMCAFGRLGPLNACGFSEPWRPVYHPPLYLSCQADCRVRRPSQADWGNWSRYGGGSYPDWILRQVNAFCRPRLGLDTALWWLGEPESTLPAEYRDYVYGVSMDPLRCAVACGLWSTGRGGYRETLAQLSADPPPEFASGPPHPFHASLLQNNELRLVRRSDRAGGALWRDPQRLARYEPNASGFLPAAALCPEQETRKPEVGLQELAARWDQPDGTAAGEQPLVRRLDPGGALPRRISAEPGSGWPRVLVIHFEARVGTYRLRIGALPEDRPGFLEVFDGARPIGFYANGAPPHPGPQEFDFGVVDPGPRELRLAVQSGPGQGLEFVELVRVSAEAVRHDYPEKAGVRATLVETHAAETPGGLRRRVHRYELLADDHVLRLAVEGAEPDPNEAGLFGDGPLLRPSTARREPGGLYGRPSGDHDVWVAVRVEDPGEADARFALGVFPTRGEAGAFLEDGPRPSAVAVSMAHDELPSGRYPLAFVRETDASGLDWWTARGAQRSGDEVLVWTLDRRDAGRMVRWAPFLEGGYRPGWGCQHALAFGPAEAPGELRVQVARAGPFLFAPRIEFRDPVRRVTLDGGDWRYFEGRTVFLPARLGDYRLELEHGEPRTPTVARTSLLVEACRWDAERRELHLHTAAPPGYGQALPGGQAYTVLVRANGYRLVGADGAEPIAPAEYPLQSESDRRILAEKGRVLRLQPGTAVLRFE